MAMAPTVSSGSPQMRQRGNGERNLATRHSAPAAVGSSDPTATTKVLNATRLRAPAYIMGSRLPLGVSPNINPGPGQYSIEGLDLSHEKGKGWSLKTGSKRLGDDQPFKRDVPGPGQYNLMEVGAMAARPGTRGCTISSRFNALPSIGTAAKTPGPGNYNLQHFKEVGSEAPGYTVRPKPEIQKNSAWAVPGPGAYSPTNTLEPRRAPAYSISSRRFVTLESHDSPGPGAYNMLESPVPGQSRAPSYSMGLKTSPLSKDHSPGPSDYISV